MLGAESEDNNKALEALDQELAADNHVFRWAAKIITSYKQGDKKYIICITN
jgi:hypothetical protein